jgi:putative transposase
MARLPRYIFPGHPQHVIQRGNNRSRMFENPADYRLFRAWLKAACEKHDCLLHAYVLMTNHVHLLITPRNERGIAKVMQSVGRRYVRYFNLTYLRTGSLWEGRYRATPIDTERYLLACYRYIELNPVRVGLASHPLEYHWSSYAANAVGRDDPLVTPHELYEDLGSDTTERRAAYRELFASSLDESTLSAIRDATNKGWALGLDPFCDRVAAETCRRSRPLPRGGSRR